MSTTNFNKFFEKISILSEEKDLSALAVDLNDIYESNKKTELFIKDLLNNPLNKEELLDKLLEIEMELDHINWHYRSLKREVKEL
ncbi:hypothetical protein [Priestia aryabhattai]